MPQAFSPTRPTLTISPGLSPKASKRISPRSPRVSRDPQYWDPQAVSEHIKRHVPQEKSPLLAKLVLDQHLDGHALLKSPRDVLETGLRVDEESQQYLMTAIDDLRARSLLPPSPRRKVQSLQQIVERLCDLASASSSPAGSATPELEPAAPADSPPPTTPVWDYGEEPNASSVQPFAYDHDHTQGHYLSFPGDPNEGFAPLLHPFEPPSPNHPDVLSALQVPRALHASTSSSSILARLESAVSVESGDHHGLAHGVQTRDDLPSHAVVPPGRDHRQPFHFHARPRSCPPERPVHHLQPPHLTQAPPLNTFRRPTPPPKTYRTIAVQTADLVDAEIQTDAMDWRSTGSEAIASVPTSAPSASARSSYASAAETISDGVPDALEGTRDTSQSRTDGQVVSSPVDLVQSREDDQHQTAPKTEDTPRGSTLPEASQDESSASSNVAQGGTETTEAAKGKAKGASGQSISKSSATTSSSSRRKKKAKSPEPDQQPFMSQNIEQSATSTPIPTTATREKPKAVQDASSSTKDTETAPEQSTSDTLEHKPSQGSPVSRQGPAPKASTMTDGRQPSSGKGKRAAQGPPEPSATATSKQQEQAKPSKRGDQATAQSSQQLADSSPTTTTEEKAAAPEESNTQGGSSSTQKAEDAALSKPLSSDNVEYNSSHSSPASAAEASTKEKRLSSTSGSQWQPAGGAIALNTISSTNADATTAIDEQARNIENKERRSGEQTPRPSASRQNSKAQQSKQEPNVQGTPVTGEANEGNSEQQSGDAPTVLSTSESVQPIKDVKADEAQSGSTKDEVATSTVGGSNPVPAEPSSNAPKPFTNDSTEGKLASSPATEPPFTPVNKHGSQGLRLDIPKATPTVQHPEPTVNSLRRSITLPSAAPQLGPSPLPTPPERGQSRLRTTSSSGRGDDLSATQSPGSTAGMPPGIDSKARPGMDRSTSFPVTSSGVSGQSGGRPPAGGHQQSRSQSTDILLGRTSPLPPPPSATQLRPNKGFGSHTNQKPKAEPTSSSWGFGGLLSSVTSTVTNSVNQLMSPNNGADSPAEPPARASSISPNASGGQRRGRDFFNDPFEHTSSPLNSTSPSNGANSQAERREDAGATSPAVSNSATSKWAPKARKQDQVDRSTSRAGTKPPALVLETHVPPHDTGSVSNETKAPPPTTISPTSNFAPPADQKKQEVADPAVIPPSNENILAPCAAPSADAAPSAGNEQSASSTADAATAGQTSPLANTLDGADKGDTHVGLAKEKELPPKPESVESAAPTATVKTEPRPETGEVAEGSEDLGQGKAVDPPPETTAAPAPQSSPAQVTTTTPASDPAPSQQITDTVNADANGSPTKPVDTVSPSSQRPGQDGDTSGEPGWTTVEHGDANVVTDKVALAESDKAADASGGGGGTEEQTHDAEAEGFVHVGGLTGRPTLPRLENIRSSASLTETPQDGSSTPALESSVSTPGLADGDDDFKVRSQEEVIAMTSKARSKYKKKYFKHFGEPYPETTPAPKEDKPQGKQKSAQK